MPENQPTRTPQESADHLAEALDNNTGALNKVKRRYRWTVLSLLALAVSLTMAIKLDHDNEVARCEAGNELRVELNDKFEHLALLLDSGGVGDSPEGRELIIVLGEDFAIRDCSDITWLG